LKPLTACLILILTSTVSAQTSHYAGDPLLLGAGARALGLGSAYVALSNDATAVAWNPAGLAHLTNREIHIQHAEQFGGSISHDVFAISSPISKGGIGLGIVRMGVDGIALTTLEDPSLPIGPGNRPITSNTVATTDYVFRVAYGRQFSANLRLGASLKIIRRNLSAGTGNGFGIDIGFLYLPTPTLRVAATLYDLTKTRISFPNAVTDRISPSLLIGTATQHPVPGGQAIISFSTRLNDQKSVVEDTQSIQLGAEYLLQQRIAFRLGYREGHFTTGTGLQLSRFGIDLAFLDHDQLDSTYRISANLFF